MDTHANAFDRAAESLGNAVELQHVNLRVPDQQAATAFYISGLGLTRDPFLMTGTDNMWANAGASQFHLPTGAPQVLRGTTGLVVPNRAQLLDRLAKVRGQLEGTRFAFAETGDGAEATCPWGNRIRCHAPDRARFGPVTLGIPYVEFDVSPGAVGGIARFYNEILGVRAWTEGAGTARALVAKNQHLVFRETDRPRPPFDGHHVQIALADFGGPYTKLRKRGLVSREDSQWQYRFRDIVDPDTGAMLFTVEHEVRSMTHPMFGRPLVNRNAALNNRNYAAGHEGWAWTMPPG
ncbi:hypothetical protein GCM10009416_32810 [Craurococcus roseus]|uniref:VOC domain-containing protein n=1 Tax=Craurococcus roseus TaxID=77585 RepID=A0ABN1FJ31_9PROT